MALPSGFGYLVMAADWIAVGIVGIAGWLDGWFGLAWGNKCDG